MKKPRILLYDIETSPNLGYVWGKYDQTVLKFARHRELLSFSYAWAHENEKLLERRGVEHLKAYCRTRQGETSDKRLVTELAKLLSEADIVVAHNAEGFDNKVVKSRMIYHGIAPLQNLCTVDTRKAAAAYFGFTGNSLDDISHFLSIGKKMPTPGFSLWEGCMANKASSWREMERYNLHDVRLLIRLYDRLRPWIMNHPNVSRILNPLNNKPGQCQYCGGTNVQKRGIRVTASRAQQRWQCMDRKCGGWMMTRLVPTASTSSNPSHSIRRARGGGK